MAITYTGDPSRLQKGAQDTASCLGELDSQLRALQNVQDELHAAVVSQHTGAAIYTTLGNAWTQGKSLAGTLQQIVDQLQQSGVHVDTQDLEGKAKLDAVQGLTAGDSTNLGDWSNSAAATAGIPKVDLGKLA
jgi:hypothetical protein